MTESGISPVIGVLLIVALTVILAALILISFYGFGDSLDSDVSDREEVDFSVNDDILEITPTTSNDELSVVWDGGSESIPADSTGETFEIIGPTKGDTVSVVDTETDRVVDKYTIQEEVLSSREAKKLEEARNSSDIIIVNNDLSSNKPEENRYNNINDAEDAFDSNNHTKILVRKGEYNENVRVNSDGLVLDGINRSDVIVSPGSGTAFYLTNGGVVNTGHGNYEISNLTVDGSGTGFYYERKLFYPGKLEDIKIRNVGIGIHYRESVGDDFYGTRGEVMNVRINSDNKAIRLDATSRMRLRNSQIIGGKMDINNNPDLIATKNWWGSPKGPSFSNSVVGGSDAIWDKWCTDKECNSLSETNLKSSDGQEFTTIQGAVDKGKNILELQSKTYTDPRSVNARIGGVELVGNGVKKTVLDGGSDGTTLRMGSGKIEKISIKNDDAGVRIKRYNSNTGSIVDSKISNVNVAIETHQDTGDNDPLEVLNSTLDASSKLIEGQKCCLRGLKARNSTILVEKIDTSSQERLDFKRNWWGDPGGPSVNGGIINSKTEWDRWCVDPDCNNLSKVNLQSGSGEKFTTIRGAGSSSVSSISLMSKKYTGSLNSTGIGNIDVTGNGVDNTIIDGGGSERVLKIGSGSLSNLTIQNGVYGLKTKRFSKNGGKIENVKIKNVDIGIGFRDDTGENSPFNIKDSTIDPSNNLFDPIGSCIQVTGRNSSLLSDSIKNSFISGCSNIDVTENWWGSSNGPDNSSDVVSQDAVKYDPYCTNKDCTTLSN